MGIKTHDGWRGHFFVLLDSPQPPQALKQWLIHCNLVCTPLQTNIGLSASGGSLIYPLDVTTCQNDKLIYISAPKCINFDDPVQDRFELYEGTSTAHLDLSAVSAATNQAETKKLVTRLRSKSGLEKKKFKTTYKNNTEILTNPDPVTVTGKKEERGFVYLNLNGGDSWGYYFPTDNPYVLYNFKGEPCLYMQDVDKDIYNEYIKDTSTDSGGTGDFVPFGFLWPADDTYYRGFANPSTGELAWLQPTGSKGKLRDFFVQNGAHLPTGWAVDEWQLDFDPTTNGKADFNSRCVNTFKCTDYIKNAKKIDHSYVPPMIDRVISSVCVDADTKKYF